MTKIKVYASDEEIEHIRQELIKWSTEEIILDLNLGQSFLDYEHPEKTRVGWLTLMLQNEELERRNCSFVFDKTVSVVKEEK